jgi:hypothetical protein
MDSGPGKLRFVILGVIVLIFGAGLMTLMHSAKAPAAKTKAPQTASAAQSKPAAAPAPAAVAAPALAQDTASPTPEPVAPMPDRSTDVAAAAAAETAAFDVPSGSPAIADDTPAESFESFDVADSGDPAMDVDSAEPASSSANPAVNTARPAVRTPSPPALDALRPWWRRDVAGKDFNVQYVGQAAREDALVFRFSKRLPDIEAAASEIRITDARGETVDGNWTKGQNEYVAVYRGVAPGRYIVHIDGDLKSASGSTLGESLQGAVYVE